MVGELLGGLLEPQLLERLEGRGEQLRVLPVPAQGADEPVGPRLGIGQDLVQRHGLLDQARQPGGAGAVGEADAIRVDDSVGRPVAGGVVPGLRGGSLMGVVELLVSTGLGAGLGWVDSMRMASSTGSIAASFYNGCQANDLRSSRQSTGDSGPETHTSPNPS